VVSGTEPLLVMFFWNFAVFLSARRLEVVCPHKSQQAQRIQHKRKFVVNLIANLHAESQTISKHFKLFFRFHAVGKRGMEGKK
jgi:hypothetical protein